jgi:hypothetical protein
VKDTHALITVLVAVKILLIAIITLAVKARRALKEIRAGLETLGVVKKKGAPETAVLKPDPVQPVTGTDTPCTQGAMNIQYPPAPANTQWDEALLEEIENISRLTCCAAQHNAELPNALHNGTAVVVSIEDMRRLVLWGLSKAREQGVRDGERQTLTKLLAKQAAPPAVGEPPSAGA